MNKRQIGNWVALALSLLIAIASATTSWRTDARPFLVGDDGTSTSSSINAPTASAPFAPHRAQAMPHERLREVTYYPATTVKQRHATPQPRHTQEICVRVLRRIRPHPGGDLSQVSDKSLRTVCETVARTSKQSISIPQCVKSVRPNPLTKRHIATDYDAICSHYKFSATRWSCIDAITISEPGTTLMRAAHRCAIVEIRKKLATAAQQRAAQKLTTTR